MRRYQITIQRDFIVPAETPEQAIADLEGAMRFHAEDFFASENEERWNVEEITE